VRACSYHEDRVAVGICMRCRRAICAACCTRLDGVNHCHRCLKELGRRAAEPRTPRASGMAAPLAVLLVGALLVFLEVLFLVEGKLAP
jgi:hypothetical protein